MEQKSILISALSVGVGVGLGLASGSQTVNNWTGSGSASNAVTPDKMEKELLRQIVDGRESTVTFDQFPYYLHLNQHQEKTRKQGNKVNSVSQNSLSEKIKR